MRCPPSCATSCQPVVHSSMGVRACTLQARICDPVQHQNPAAARVPTAWPYVHALELPHSHMQNAIGRPVAFRA